MKKVFDSGPGWYEDPEDYKRERFWNGSHWEQATRPTLKSDTVIQAEVNEAGFQLGRMFFRSPLKEDKAFKVFAVLAVISCVSSIYQEIQSGLGLIGAILASLFIFPLISLYLYILFLPFLLIRRRKDKKRELEYSYVARATSPKTKIFAFGGLGIVILCLLYLAGGGMTNSSSKGDLFLKHQAEIGEVLSGYNVEAAVAVGVVRGISDGTIDPAEGIVRFAEANSKITPKLRDLRIACESVEFPKVQGSGEELAIAKAFNMLRVVCDVTPKQFIKLQEIFREQIAEEGTQGRLDQLSAELESLGRAKRDAAIEGIDAFLPYADEAQASLLRTLKEGFERQ